MYNPTVPSHVADYVVNAYVNLRNLMVRPTQDPSGRYNKDKRGGTDFQYTTARSLLAIIRLSSALVSMISFFFISRLDCDLLIVFKSPM